MFISFLIGGVDYNSGPYNVTFITGMASATFNVFITDDNILEDDKMFILIINKGPLQHSSNKDDLNNKATVIIKDDDGKFDYVS